jgi:hypothetical protein
MLAPLGGDHSAGWARGVVINVGPTQGVAIVPGVVGQGGQSGCGHEWSCSSRSGGIGGARSSRFGSSRSVMVFIAVRCARRWPRRYRRLAKPIHRGRGRRSAREWRQKHRSNHHDVGVEQCCHKSSSRQTRDCTSAGQSSSCPRKVRARKKSGRDKHPEVPVPPLAALRTRPRARPIRCLALRARTGRGPVPRARTGRP